MAEEAEREAKRIFLAALEMVDPSERQAYLNQACEDDEGLKNRVEELLLAAAGGGGIVDKLPEEFVPTDLMPTVSEKVGTTVGRYKLMEQIGEGGFGLVFVAEQQQPVRRKVALKIIKPGMDTKDVVARFEAERQALALMDHPNIAKVLDAGTTELGHPYFVMELVRGVPITQYCDTNQLTTRERLELFVAVCRAVQHAHQKGIIHRDIKPSNVLVTLHDGEPVVKVIDFGVAKALHQPLTERTIYTRFAQMIGTPIYMSPEQAEMSGLDIDTRSDIYSLGVLLYELLTGTTPLTKERLAQAAYNELVRLIREEEPPVPSTRLSQSGEALATIAAQRKSEPGKLSKLVRGDLDWITMKALEKDRTRRYESASGFAADVLRYLADEAVEASPPSKWYRLRKTVRKYRGAIVTAGMLMGVLIAGVVASSVFAIREQAARGVADRNAETARRETEKAEAARSEAEEEKQRAEAEREKAEVAKRAADKSAVKEAEAAKKAEEAAAGERRTREEIAVQLTRNLMEKGVSECTAGRVDVGVAYLNKAYQTLVKSESKEVELRKSLLRLLGAWLEELPQEHEDDRVWRGEHDYPKRTSTKKIDFSKMPEEFHRDQCHVFANTQIAVDRGNDSSFHFWNLETGEKIGEPISYLGEASGWSLSGDGTRFVSVIKAEAQVWNPRTGEKVGPGIPVTPPFDWLELNQDGSRLVVSSEGQKEREHLISVWSIPDGKLLLDEVRDDLDREDSNYLDRSGHWIYTGIEGKVTLWDLRTGAKLLDGFPAKSGVNYSSSGSALIVGNKGLINVWNLMTGSHVIDNFSIGVFRSCDLSPDETKLVAWTEDGWWVWSTVTRRKIARLDEPDNMHATEVSFLPDGQRLSVEYHSSFKIIYDSMTGRLIRSGIEKEKSEICSDGLFLFDPISDTGQILNEWKMGREAEKLRFTRNSDRLAGFHPEVIQHYSLIDGKILERDLTRSSRRENSTITNEMVLSPTFSVELNDKNQKIQTQYMEIKGKPGWIDQWDSNSGRMAGDRKTIKVPSVDDLIFNGYTEFVHGSHEHRRSVERLYSHGIVGFSDHWLSIAIGGMERETPLGRSGSGISLSSDKKYLLVWGLRMIPGKHWGRFNEVIDTKTGNLIRSLAGEVPNTAWMSPDGKRVLGLCNGYARIWDVKSGGVSNPLPLYDDKEFWEIKNRLWISQSHRNVLIQINKIKITGFDLNTLKPTGSDTLCPSVWSTEFRQGDTLVIVGEQGKKLHSWNIETGEKSAESEFIVDPVGLKTPLCFWKTRRGVIQEKDGTIQIWDLDSGKLLGEEFKASPTKDATEVGDSYFGFIDFEGGCQVIRSTDGRPAFPAIRPPDGIKEFTSSSDGRRLITVGSRGNVSFWNGETGELISGPYLHEDTEVLVKLQGQPYRALTKSGKTLRLWNLESGKLECAPMVMNEEFSEFGFSEDKELVYASRAAEISRLPAQELYDLSAGKLITDRFPDSARTRKGTFSRDGSLFFLDEGEVGKIFEVQTGEVLREISLKDRIVFDLCRYGEALLWLEQFYDQSQNRFLLSLFACNPDSSQQAIYQTEGSYRLGQIVPEMERLFLEKNAEEYEGIELLLLDWQTGRELRPSIPYSVPFFTWDGRRFIIGHDNSGSSWFSNDSAKINYSVNPDSKIQILDTMTGRPIGTSILMDSIVTDLAVSSDSKLLAIASENQSVKVFDLDTGAPFGSGLLHSDGAKTVCFSPDGKKLVTSDESGKVRVFSVPQALPDVPRFVEMLSADRSQKIVDENQFSSDFTGLLGDGSKFDEKEYSELGKGWFAEQEAELEARIRGWQIHRAWTTFDYKNYSSCKFHLDQIVEDVEKNPRLMALRGMVGAVLDQRDLSARDIERALSMGGDDTYLLKELAWFWSTCPEDRCRNGKRAVESALKACELTEWKDGGIIDTLAAGYAEVGEFEKAVEMENKAIELISDEVIKKGMLERLELYKAKKSYRDVPTEPVGVVEDTVESRGDGTWTKSGSLMEKGIEFGKALLDSLKPKHEPVNVVPQKKAM